MARKEATGINVVFRTANPKKLGITDGFVVASPGNEIYNFTPTIFGENYSEIPAADSPDETFLKIIQREIDPDNDASYVWNENDEREWMWDVFSEIYSDEAEYCPKHYLDAAGAIISVWDIFERNNAKCDCIICFGKNYRVVNYTMLTAASNVMKPDSHSSIENNRNISFRFSTDNKNKKLWQICSSFRDNQDDRYAISDGVVDLSSRGLVYAGCMYYKMPRKGFEDKRLDADYNITMPADPVGKERWEIYDDRLRNFTCDVHTFVEIKDGTITFWILLENKLYKKIEKTNERVTFYYTPFEKEALSRLPENQDDCPENVVFEKRGGKYCLKSQNDIVFNVPENPDSPRVGGEDYDSEAMRLYSDLFGKYTNAFCSAFALTNDEIKYNGRTFKRDGQVYKAETDGVTVAVKCDVVNIPKQLPANYSFLTAAIEMPFTENNIRIAFNYLNPKDTDIVVKKDDEEYCTRYSTLEIRRFFKETDKLPQNVTFHKELEKLSEDFTIYQLITRAILNSDIDRFFNDYCTEIEPMYAKVKEELCAAFPEYMPSNEVVQFAAELKKRHGRLNVIPNIAIVGEAGVGKSTTAKVLAGLFKKSDGTPMELLCLGPSNLKGAYIGQTQFAVLSELAKAAAEEKIIFIDEAYELMSDSFGSEAVALLLPLMSGDRDVITASRGTEEITIDYKNRLIVEEDTGTPGYRKETCININHQAIWIGGYEDEIRLLLSNNQGLFRRLKRITLKTPNADELFELLKKRLNEEKENDKRTDSQSKAIYNILDIIFNKNRAEILKFFRWGSRPETSKFFASRGGVENFLNFCLDKIDPNKEVTVQIDKIITDMKHDINKQIDVVKRRKSDGHGNYYLVSESDSITMIADNKTRFSDLVGCDAQVRYMENIINMFVHKSEYERNNISVPKGVLLLGAPGVGKTFIARAMAGELQARFEKEAPYKRVGFMSLSAPELVAGGVSYIGSVFTKAEEYDECVIFIDEVDAIAKDRRYNNHYDHFIELIKQMDGVEQRSNVFILAATNAYEMLDPAFVRAGRIDKKLEFTLPDREARRILAERGIIKRGGALENFRGDDEKFIEGIKALAKETAKLTQGFTAGEIESTVSDAFISKRENGANINHLSEEIKEILKNDELRKLYVCIYESVESRLVGDPRPAVREPEFNTEKNDNSCSATAVHEVGHVLMEALTGNEPFEKITSIPRGSALGYVIPSLDRTMITKKDFENKICYTMGGRAAEEIIYGKDNVSAGASSDMNQATHLARYMVERSGFTDEIGFMSLVETTSRHLGGSDYTCSPELRAQSDRVVNELLKKLYSETLEMLRGKEELIKALAKEVFDRESMTGAEFMECYRKLNPQSGDSANK